MPVFERDKRFTRKARNTPEPPQALGEDFVHTPRDSGRQRELTTLNIVLLLAISAIVVTAYIANTVMVDNLMRSITSLDQETALMLQKRESLRAEINYLSSSTRIQRIAMEKLQLEHARQQPYSLTVFGLSPGKEQE